MMILSLLSLKSYASIPLQLSQRTGNPHCWVKLKAQHEKWCIDQRTWNLALSSQALSAHYFLEKNHSFSSARWRVRASLKNTPHQRKVSQILRHISIAPARELLFSRRFKSILKRIENQREKISATLRPHDPQGILRSLILHEGTNQEPLPMMHHLGFVHLINASGIHLYVIHVSIRRLLQGLSSRLKLPFSIGSTLGNLLSFLSCLGVWILSGARIGLLRPLWVMGLRHLLRYWGGRWSSGSPLLLAILFDLILSRAILGESFSTPSGRWIYALAVGGGLLWHHSFTHHHWGLAVGSWILVAGMEIWESSSTALATPLFSWITLPLICLGIYPTLLTSLALDLLGLKELSQLLLKYLSQIFHLLFNQILHLSVFPGNLWIISPLSLLKASLLSSALLIVLIKYKANKKRQSTWVILIYTLLFYGLGFRIFYPTRTRFLQTHLAERVIQLDVGQGDAALVIGPRPGLIDTGSSHTLSDQQWLQIFSQFQINSLSWIFLTHLDEDHAGAVHRLSKLIPIRCIIATERQLASARGTYLKNTLEALKIPIHSESSACIPFPTFDLSSTRRSPSKKSGNDHMGAIFIPLQGGGFYLSAGDADSEDELKLTQALSPYLRERTSPRILKISHHGSRFSTTHEWLTQIRPSEAWISAGIGNTYGHPSVMTLSLLKRRGIPIRRTDQEGALSSLESATKKLP